MKNLDKYLANLLVGNVMLHNLHWNVVGFNFKGVHEYLEELYDDFFEKYDEVAEYQKVKGIYPKASVKEYLELSDLQELKSEDIQDKDAIVKGLELIKHMKDLALEIAEESECFELSNMMEDHISEYNEIIWFMESMLK